MSAHQCIQNTEKRTRGRDLKMPTFVEAKERIKVKDIIGNKNKANEAHRCHTFLRNTGKIEMWATEAILQG